MVDDREAITALKIRALQNENHELKHRIKATIRYIERSTEMGLTFGCDDILDVVVGVLSGDIK